MEIGTKTPRISVAVSMGPYLLWTGSSGRQCGAGVGSPAHLHHLSIQALDSLLDPTVVPANYEEQSTNSSSSSRESMST